MSKSGTWPGGVVVEASSNMDSAGSCDSVISMNSGYSEDSMEHLTAEERACLMYLEETIEALEVQEDSGLSNDESEALSRAAKQKDHMRENDISVLISESGPHGESRPPAPVVAAPLATSTQTGTEHHAVSQRFEPQNTPTAAQPSPPAPEPATGDKMHSTMGLAGGGNAHPESGTSSGPWTGVSTESPEIELAIIPPPSDFMDEPDTPSLPEKAKDVPPPEGISAVPKETVSLNPLHSDVPVKKTSISPPVIMDPPAKPPPISALSTQLSHPPEIPELKSPPAVAPKPKKLPANILLKSNKSVVDGSSGHSVASSSDRLLLDPQRVRMEALRKLGLIKSNEEETVPSLSPKLPAKHRPPWTAPSPPVSPAAPRTPPMTPPAAHPNSPPPTSRSALPAALPSATTAAPPAQAPDVLPAPAAFRDPSGSLSSNGNLTTATPPLTPPTPVKQRTSPKVTAIKSATLERSGLGLSRYIADQHSAEAGQGTSGEQSPRQLRSARPRPASLGSGKEFSQAKGEDFRAGHAGTTMPVLTQPGPQHSKESAKLPRAQGISVLICPRAEDDDNRREALKKLGLLRD
ncbi:unnamed protein product [Menidia menidia]|uniref:(Atlantic silverside) hypothetical protein n=1 Tax=Menidia menidia TaxID=238744 RepID=A0A8S4BZT9_9TELE|nr:unnamed protein product [Menidia menidia]